MRKATLDYIREGELTQTQFNFLSWLYLAGYKSSDDVSVVWNPKEYMGRTPTPSEAVTLSRRKTLLIQRKLLEQEGKTLKVTAFGQAKILSYASKHPSATNDIIKAILQMHEDKKRNKAIGSVVTELHAHYEDIGLSKEEMVSMRNSLLKLARLFTKRSEANREKVMASRQTPK